MSTPLVDFFTRIGFQVDKASLKPLEAQISALESRFKSLADTVKGVSNNTTIRAAARLANAEAKKINAELGLTKQQLGVEKLKQQNILEGTRLERNKQMTAKVVEQSRLQELRNKAQEFRQQRSASRVGVNSHGGMSFGIPMDSVKGAVGTVAGIETARRFAQQSFRVGNFQIAQPAQFEFVTGSAEEAQKEIAFLNSEVDRLSLNMMDANKQYLKLFAAGGKKIGSEKTRELFSGFQNLATMLGLSGDAQNRGLNSFTQMISKGQVYSEELKGQLAEALPGATEIFADALFGDGTRGSGDTKKLFKAMEDGKVGIEELIKVIEYMRKLTDDKKIKEYVEKSPEKAFQRMSNAWMRLIMEVNNAGLLDAMTATLDGVADTLKTITPYIKEIASLFKELWPTLKGIAFYWGVLFAYNKLLPAISAINKYLLTVKGLTVLYRLLRLKIFSLVKANSVLAASNTTVAGSFLLAAKAAARFLMRVLVIPTAILMIIDLIETLQGKQTILSELMKQDDWVGNAAKGFYTIGRLFEGLGELIGQVFGALATGDWGQFDFSDLKKDLLNIFPFDVWGQNFLNLFRHIGEKAKLLGKYVAAAWNPFASSEERVNALKAYENYSLISGAPMQVLGSMTKPSGFSPSPTSMKAAQELGNVQFNFDMAVHGTDLSDPQKFADIALATFKEELPTLFTQQYSNYVMKRVPR